MRLRLPALFAITLLTASVAACGPSGSKNRSGTVAGGASGRDGGTTSTTSGDDGTGTSNGTDTPSPAPGSKVDVTDETLSTTGSTHHYVLAVPKSYDPSKKYPLVLVLHGDGQTGAVLRQMFELDDVTGDEAIVAYPTGNNQTWDLYTPYASNDDQQFLVALVEALAGRYSIDRSRVFGAGYSSGAFQINQMACRKAGFFRGILSFSGGAPADPQAPNAPKYANGMLQCPNGGPVAAFVVHGDSDHTVDPQSGDYDAQYWQYVNGCQPSRTDTPPSSCRKADGCPSSTPVVFCLVPGLDHLPWSPGAQAGWALFKSL